MLVTKESWKDIEEVIKIINSLRKEQSNYEQNYLNEIRAENAPYGSAELVSLYHLAKMVDLLGQFVINGTTNDIENQIEYHSRIASDFLEVSQNIAFYILLKYFKDFAIKLIRNTIWYNLRGVNHYISEFNKFIAKKDKNGIFELLYPQKKLLKNRSKPSNYFKQIERI